ncbi:MAG: 2-hydroxychromene-2-carboxylate isomerase [Alphaproteobacteria bacterium]|nr:2-hydroxychromene-2-carboxylate isomerase [Alphaproteobacteria bacterium]
MRIEFYHDVVCPYAWMASRRIEAIAERYRAELVWRPVLLGGVFKAIEAPQVPAEQWSEQRQLQIQQDLTRQAEAQGLSLSMHPRHPVRSVDAMRLIVAADEAERPALIAALYSAYFEKNEDIDDMSVLARYAQKHGVKPDAIRSDRVKNALRVRTDEAVALGVFGVPAVFVYDDDDALVGWWWGQDRLHFVEAALGGPPVCPGFLAPRIPGSLRLFYDFSSPFAYMASHAAPRLAEDRGLDLRWTPILLGALFREIGTPDVPMFAMSEPKRRYVARDLQDWAAWWGVPFTFPEVFPVRTVLPLRVALQEQAAVAPLFHALWGEGRDIGQAEVVREVLQDAGLDAEGLIAGAADKAVKAQLRENTDEAVALGVCGVPTVQVNGGLLIWGQDRMPVVEAALEGRLSG